MDGCQRVSGTSNRIYDPVESCVTRCVATAYAIYTFVIQKVFEVLFSCFFRPEPPRVAVVESAPLMVESLSGSIELPVVIVEPPLEEYYDATTRAIHPPHKNLLQWVYDVLRHALFSGNATSKEQKYLIGMQECFDKVGAERIDTALRLLEGIPNLWKMYQLLYLLKNHALLSGESRNTATERPLDPREAYQRFVPLLDSVSEMVGEETPPSCTQLLFDLVEVRWARVNFSGHIEELLKLLTEEFAKTSGGSIQPTIPENLDMKGMIVLFAQFSKMFEVGEFEEHTKSTLATTKQRLEGVYIADYAAKLNVPNELMRYSSSTLGEAPCEVVFMRHPSPTRGDKEQSISPNYHLFIEGLKRKGKALLYACHQRKNPPLGLLTIEENESLRTGSIRKLEESHDNVFVLIQPMEGPIFNGMEPILAVDSFKEAILSDMLEEGEFSWGGVPLPFRTPHYKGELRILLDFVHSIFFRGKEELTQEERQDFLTLFYDFQRFHLEAKIREERHYQVGAVVTACKNNVDRGSVNAFVRFVLMTYTLDRKNDSELLKQGLIRIVMMPFITLKRGIYEKRVKQAFRAAERVRRTFEGHPNLLREFKEGFKTCTHLYLHDMQMTKAEGQTAKIQLGALTLTRELMEVRLQELIREGNHYVVLPLDAIQSKEEVFKQVRRDMAPGGIQQFIYQQEHMNPIPLQEEGDALYINRLWNKILTEVDGGEEEARKILSCCHQGAFARYEEAIRKEIGVTRGMDSRIQLSGIPFTELDKYGFHHASKPLQTYRISNTIKVRGHYLIKYILNEAQEDLSLVQIDIEMDPKEGRSEGKWRVLPLDGIKNSPGY